MYVIIAVDHILGAEHLREQAGAAASYIEANEQLHAKTFVGGVTYGKMGGLAIRLGLRRMAIKQIDLDQLASLRAAHMAYCAVNGMWTDFEPVAVSLPT